MKILEKKKYILFAAVFCFIVTLLIGITYLTSGYTANAAVVESENEDNFIVTDTLNEVAATYTFARLNETDCSVKISNKSEATIAVIPSKAEIDGTEYRVTEVAANGFASSPKLLRVKLPASIKKVNNMAFSNCAALERIDLSNVVEIGSNVFYRCPKLNALSIPKSVKTIGSTILRGNTTDVYVRASAAGENWSTSWNTGNNSSNVEYNSTYKAPLELETVYSAPTARSSTPVMVGYVVAGGQPRTDSYYIEEDSNIFIPNMYNGEIILGISESAFIETAFNQLVIEYSSQSIWIGSLAFSGVDCNNITINRDVEFYDYSFDMPSDNIFSFSSFKSIILPDTISEIPLGAFYDCNNLSNIYFNTPVYREKREDVLKFIDDFNADETEGTVHLTQNAGFNTIGESAFDGTTSIRELHIYSNVENMEQTVFSNWTEKQKVYIHNADANFTKGWHIDALSGLDSENVVYDTTYYNIEFDAGIGAAETDVKEVKANEPVGELPVPEAPYKVFIGWYYGDTEYTAETVYNAESDITLTAMWRNNMYSVEYNANRPNEASRPVVGTMQKSSHEYGVSSALCENAFTIAGWHFVGWNTSSDGSGTSFANKAQITELNAIDGATTTLYAQWQPNTYSVVYEKNLPAAVTGNYGVEGTMEKTDHVYDVSSQLRANAYTLKGWEFMGWSATPGGGSGIMSDRQTVSDLYEYDGDCIALYAQWQLISYDIYIREENASYTWYGSYTIESPTVNFPIIERYGYEPIWTPQNVPQYSTGNVYATATFQTKYFNIQYILNGGSDADISNPTWYNAFDHVELQAPTRDGYRFVGWKCNGKYITNLDGMTEDVVLEAVWERILTLDISCESIRFDEAESMIILPDEQFVYGCTITVGSGVSSFTAISGANVVYLLNIIVEERTSDLNLTLNGVSMKSHDKSPAIYALSEITINLYTNGVCKIYGKAGNAGITGRNGGAGYSAISCHALKVYGSNISFYGGSGGAGGKGIDYTNKVGGNGANGGNGACAITVADSVTFIGKNITVKGGNGANGGAGGTGSFSSVPPTTYSYGGWGGSGAQAVNGTVYYAEGSENIDLSSGTAGARGPSGLNIGFVN